MSPKCVNLAQKIMWSNTYILTVKWTLYKLLSNIQKTINFHWFILIKLTKVHFFIRNRSEQFGQPSFRNKMQQFCKHSSISNQVKGYISPKDSITLGKKIHLGEDTKIKTINDNFYVKYIKKFQAFLFSMIETF